MQSKVVVVSVVLLGVDSAVVERSFAWATRFRRLAKDYERLPQTVAGLHFLAFVCLMLRNVAEAMRLPLARPASCVAYLLLLRVIVCLTHKIPDRPSRDDAARPLSITSCRGRFAAHC